MKKIISMLLMMIGSGATSKLFCPPVGNSEGRHLTASTNLIPLDHAQSALEQILSLFLIENRNRMLQKSPFDFLDTVETKEWIIHMSAFCELIKNILEVEKAEVFKPTTYSEVCLLCINMLDMLIKAYFQQCTQRIRVTFAIAPKKTLSVIVGFDVINDNAEDNICPVYIIENIESFTLSSSSSMIERLSQASAELINEYNLTTTGLNTGVALCRTVACQASSAISASCQQQCQQQEAIGLLEPCQSKSKCTGSITYTSHSTVPVKITSSRC